MKQWKPLKLEELSEDTKKVYEVLNDESDLACVMIGTSYLAELLATILKVLFIETNVSEKILDPKRGAVGGFVTRADLAYCLGLIHKSAYQDLIKIAEIRNQFAHRHFALDFSETTVRKSCDELQAWRVLLLGKDGDLSDELTLGHAPTRARIQFNTSVVLLGTRIHLDALSKKSKIK